MFCDLHAGHAIVRDIRSFLCIFISSPMLIDTKAFYVLKGNMRWTEILLAGAVRRQRRTVCDRCSIVVFVRVRSH